MIRSESVSRANVRETLNQDRGLIIARFLRAFDVLITKKEGKAEFSKCLELGKLFFSFISSPCFMEHISGYAYLDGRGHGREGMIMQAVI